MRGRSTAATAPKSSGAEFIQLVEQIGREKGIDVEILIEALEDAITTASRKQQERAIAARSAAGGPTSQEILVCRLNRQLGELQLYARKMVVDRVGDPNLEIALAEARKIDPEVEAGGHVELSRSTKGLGRIEAQAAKQVIFQKVREAERDLIYNEYGGRVGQLVNGTVKRFERGDIIVELGRAEALLPRRFQSRVEMYSQGDRVRAIVVEVSRLAKGPPIVLSRTDPSLLVKLFEMEVPEIYDGTVVLRYAVREPGERAKVAVSSRERDVDPVGACVGMKGSRVQAIIRELRGEKIDIVQWSEEISTLAANALNPAKVGRVERAPDVPRTLEVVVDEQQLSLAIGKKGQNVRLAAKLVGWRIDIKSEDDKRQEVENQLTEMTRRSTPLAEVPGISEKQSAKLAEAGIETVDTLLSAPLETLTSVPSVGDKMAARLREAAEDFLHTRPSPDPGSAAAAPASAATPTPADDTGSPDDGGTDGPPRE